MSAVGLNDAEILQRVEEIEKSVSKLDVGEHIAVLLEQNEKMLPIMQAMIEKFGEKSVGFGGMPAIFPNMVRVVVYRDR